MTTKPMLITGRIVDVQRKDENGKMITQTFRVPTIDDWQKNLVSLNKKIIKTFNIKHEYALCIKQTIIRHNDYKALTDIIAHSNDLIPKIEIVNKNTLKTIPLQNSEQIRKILIHSADKHHTFIFQLDIHESKDEIFTHLMLEIQQQFGITHKQSIKLYEKCDEKQIHINDCEDLYESLQNTKSCDTLHLYIEQKETLHAIYENQSCVIYHEHKQVDRTAKVVLLGDSGVGKSSIEQRFVCNRFSEWMTPTIGALFSRRTLDYISHRFTFEIWDTAGQERFKSLTPLFYRNASAALVVYDITNYTSYDNALRWINEVHSYDDDIVIALCGNKSDLYEERKISYEKVKQWVVNNDIAIFGETSAKTDVNITQMFRKIGEVIAKTSVLKDRDNMIRVEENDNEYDADSYCSSYCRIV